MICGTIVQVHQKATASKWGTNELALALFAHPGLHETAQDEKDFWQFPTGQRGCLIKRIGLLFDQRQIMKRVIDVILLLPRPRVTGDDLSPAGNHHLMHIAPHQNRLMTVGSRNRIIVAAVTHERQRTHTNRLLVAGVVGNRRQGLEPLRISLKPLANGAFVTT